LIALPVRTNANRSAEPVRANGIASSELPG
jgi:hypothetical protein